MKAVKHSLVLKDGSNEALKWIALGLMTGDHINKYLCNSSMTILYDAGRIAAPLFLFVIAYNMARAGSMENGAHERTMKRLAIFGIISTPIFIALGNLIAAWWPLNIMFTLLASVAAIYLFERGKYWSGVLTLAAGGFLAEFSLPAIGLCISTYSYFKRPSWFRPTWFVLLIGAACSFLLCILVNKNLWAFGAIPLILAAAKFDFKVPRAKWFFYAYYPAHLLIILIIRTKLSDAGYFFVY